MSKRVTVNNPDDSPKVHLVGGKEWTAKKWFIEQGYTLEPEIALADVCVFLDGPAINPLLYGQRLVRGTKINYIRDREDIKALRMCNSEATLVGFGRGAHFLNATVGLGSSIQKVGDHNHGRHTATSTESQLIVTVPSTHSDMMVPGEHAQLLLQSKVAMSYVMENGQMIRLRNITDRHDPAIITPDPETILYSALDIGRDVLCFQALPWVHGFDHYNSYVKRTLMQEGLSKVHQESLQKGK